MKEVPEFKANNVMLKISYRFFFCIASLYVVLPVLIFFIGFLKPWVAVISSAILLSSFGLAYKELSNHSFESGNIEISLHFCIGCLLFAIIWSVVAGIGEFTWTTEDHNVRYAILNDLVSHKWPFFIDLSNQSDPHVTELLGTDQVAFAYYFTFWMIPALTGKLFGLTVARVVLVVWSGAGLFITMIGISFIIRKMTVLIPLTMFFFAGFDMIPYFIRSRFLDGGGTWEGWNIEFYIHGNFYQTMNVFNQTIPGWVIIVLLLTFVNNKYIGTVASVMFCYSPWATIGLIPIALYELFKKENRTGNVKRDIKNIFSFGNIALPIVIMVIFGALYKANPNATDIRGFIWFFFDRPIDFLIPYILYVIIEFGIWVLIIGKENRSAPLLKISVITLLIMPVYKISRVNDFLMRGTMAPMFVVMTMVIVKLCRDYYKSQRKALVTLIGLLLSGLTALLLVSIVIDSFEDVRENNIHQSKDEIISFADMASSEEAELWDRQFFVHDYDDTFFYKYLGKTPD